MIKNKKGFMLVEVIVTSTVIMATMVLLYSGFSQLFSKYETRMSYHHVDAMYASKEMMDYLLEEDFNDFVNGSLYSNESVYLIQEGTCNMEGKESFCNTFKDLYGVRNIIFTSYDKSTLENLKNGNAEVGVVSVSNETMKEYLDYVIGYYNITDANIDVDDNPYSYVLLTEIYDGEDYYYANLPIR